jgi:hypothetical protein
MRFLTSRVSVLALSIVATMVATSAFGSLISDVVAMPLWGTDTAQTANTSITPDGKFLVYGETSTTAYFYNVATATASQPNGGGMVPGSLNGIGYRTDPVSAQQQVIMSGFSGQQAVWMTLDGGLTWGAKFRNTSFAPLLAPTVNGLGSQAGQDAFYLVNNNNTSSGPMYVNKAAGNWTASITPTWTYSSANAVGGKRTLQSVSASGRGVGWGRPTSGVSQNMIMDFGSGTVMYFPGLVGVSGNNDGTMYSVSADGNTIFGNSPTVAAGTTVTGYKATFSGTGLSTVQLSLNALPQLPSTAGSVTLQVPYGTTADGRYASGMDYVGSEHAALWDTSDSNPANWTVIDLLAYAQSRGIGAGWTALSRAYSVGIDATTGDPVVAGVGVYNGKSRAFIMEVPEPSALALLGLGMFGLLAFRRRP